MSQTVVITGASAGVGRATARALARRGARLGLIARGAERLDATRAEVERLGGQAVVFAADVADADAIEAAASAVEDHFGAIDVWINNAMVSVFSRTRDMTIDDYQRVTDVTYLGTVRGTLAALRRMLPRDHGTIVQVGSALAYRGIPLQSAYCAAKHAIQGFTDSLRCELLHEGTRVRVTMVQLPALNTPQFEWSKSHMPRQAQPVPPIYQPEVAARAILWAATHDRREVQVGLSTVLAIAADKLAPGLSDRYLAWAGVDAQMTSEPRDPDRPNNLYEAVSGGDWSARGRFDARAHAESLQLTMTTHRRWVAAAVLGASALAILLRRSSR